MNRLSYEEVSNIKNWNVYHKPFNLPDGWIRKAETDKYFYDDNPLTLDHRIVDKTSNIQYPAEQFLHSGSLLLQDAA